MSETSDKISQGLDAAAEVTEALNQDNVVQTGKMSVWLRIGAMIAKLGGSLVKKR